MKIQCDVCNQNDASVYCSADEAALCSACDHRVHHANKLAGKHPRFSLLHPSTPKDSPLCDICQQKKAFLFCQQDRAILCNDCDAAIHKVNQHKQNHTRFLLTGVKLSPTPCLYSSSSSSPSPTKPTSKNDVVPVPVPHKLIPSPSPIINQPPNFHQQLNGSGHGSSTSSISEYLIEMLPGWHVEDFLDPTPNLSKAADKDPAPIWGGDMINGSFNSFMSPESLGMWVPQAPPAVIQRFEPPTSVMGFGDEMINGSSLVFDTNNHYTNVNKIGNATKSSRKRIPDNGNCFTVPQISPPSTTFKRSRTLWH